MTAIRAASVPGRRRRTGVEAVGGDVQVRRAVASWYRPQRVAERAAGNVRDECESVLSGFRGEAVDVDETNDLTGVGGDVRDHHAAVGVGDEQDRARRSCGPGR